MSVYPANLFTNVTGVFDVGLVSTTLIPHTTPIPDTTPTYVGYVCAVIAVVFYGSNFVPVKQFETGDGMFFQWILCCGVFMVGIGVNIIQTSVFYPLAMVGGVVWCTGNLCVVPILKTIGLSLGLCLWATVNLLAGWFSARFGMFGINKEIPGNEVMNDISVGLAVISAVVYTQVKSDISMSEVLERVIDDPEHETGVKNELLIGQIKKHQICEESDVAIKSLTKRNRPLTTCWMSGKFYSILTCVFLCDYSQTTGSSNSLVTGVESETIYVVQTHMPANHEPSFFEKLPPLKKRLLGIALAIFSGTLYGLNFVPAIYIQNRIADSSQKGIDYVFAHFCGIFMASTIYFAIYAIVQRNKPKIYPKVILPGLLSGIMWAAATACFFVANEVLSEPVSFPIINTGPALIASGWGVLLFKEITGKKNLLILSFAFCLTISTGLLAGFSKSAS